MEVAPLCPCKNVDTKTKICPECKIGWYTNVINDENADLDHALIESYMRRYKENVVKASPGFLEISRGWFLKHNRVVVFIACFDTIYHLMHSSELYIAPVEMLEDLRSELEPTGIWQRLERDPYKTKTPFNPCEQIALLIRTSFLVVKDPEENDEESTTKIAAANTEMKAAKSNPSRDLCCVITPSIMMMKKKT